jgi:hypothetical protein
MTLRGEIWKALVRVEDAHKWHQNGTRPIGISAALGEAEQALHSVLAALDQPAEGEGRIDRLADEFFAYHGDDDCVPPYDVMREWFARAAQAAPVAELDEATDALRQIVALKPHAPFRYPSDELVEAQEIARAALARLTGTEVQE